MRKVTINLLDYPFSRPIYAPQISKNEIKVLSMTVDVEYSDNTANKTGISDFNPQTST
jgi:hypothetical protein